MSDVALLVSDKRFSLISVYSAWRAVTAAFVLNGALLGIWASRIPAVRDVLDLSHEDLGLGLLFVAVGAVCSFPVTGRLTDRFGAFRVTRIISVLYPASLVLLALAGDFASLAAFLFIFGVFHGSMDVAMNAWAAEVEQVYDKPLMPSFHAMWSFGAGLGAASGFFAIGYGVSVFDHFLWAGLAVAVLTLAMSHVPWVSKRSASSDAPAFALPSGILILVGLAALCGTLGEGAITDWSAIYLRDELGAAENIATLGFTTFSITMVLCRLSGGFVIAQLGTVLAARLSGVCAAIGVLCVVTGQVLGLVLFGFAMMGVGYALLVPIAFTRAANDPKVPPGRAIASVATLGYGGFLIGPPLIGFLADLLTLRLAFAVLLPLAILSILVAGALKRAA